MTMNKEDILRRIMIFLERDEPIEEQVFRIRTLIQREISPDNPLAFHDWIHRCK